jgi:hypothetical protein
VIGERKFVADVGGEPGFALEPHLHCIGHLVERFRQAGQVGVGFRRHAGVEATDAISPAVVATREMGRSSRRLVDQPSAPAKIVVTAIPIASAVPMARKARSVSLSGTASKYWALAAGDVEADGHVRLTVEVEPLRGAAAETHECHQFGRIRRLLERGVGVLRILTPRRSASRSLRLLRFMFCTRVVTWPVGRWRDLQERGSHRRRVRTPPG